MSTTKYGWMVFMVDMVNRGLIESSNHIGKKME